VKGRLDKNVSMVEEYEEKIIVLLHISYKFDLIDLDFMSNFIESKTLEDFTKEYKLNINNIQMYYQVVFVINKCDAGRGIIYEYVKLNSEKSPDYLNFLKMHFQILPIDLTNKIVSR
jgi:hypothetical protein